MRSVFSKTNILISAAVLFAILVFSISNLQAQTNKQKTKSNPVYFIVCYSVHDMEAYDRYMEGFGEIATKTSIKVFADKQPKDIKFLKGSLPSEIEGRSFMVGQADTVEEMDKLINIPEYKALYEKDTGITIRWVVGLDN